jgi:hypothetical protein
VDAAIVAAVSKRVVLYSSQRRVLLLRHKLLEESALRHRDPGGVSGRGNMHTELNDTCEHQDSEPPDMMLRVAWRELWWSNSEAEIS